MPFSGLFELMVLIALGVGYLVIYFAKREEKELQFVGYIIGGVIIVLAGVQLISNIWFQAKFCGRAHAFKGMMQKRMMPQQMPMAPQPPAKKQ